MNEIKYINNLINNAEIRKFNVTFPIDQEINDLKYTRLMVLLEKHIESNKHIKTKKDYAENYNQALSKLNKHMENIKAAENGYTSISKFVKEETGKIGC